MPAELVPHTAIPELAARAAFPGALDVLRRIQTAGFIKCNKNLDDETASALRRFAEWGLVDWRPQTDEDRPTDRWTNNANGERVLNYLTGIRFNPHYEVHSTELAAWVEEQGADIWWRVGADSVLAGLRSFPCTGPDVAHLLRRLNRPLLVQAKPDDENAKGQVVGKEKLGDIVKPPAKYRPKNGVVPEQIIGRTFWMCWKNSILEWDLYEDCQKARWVREERLEREEEAANLR